MEADHGQWWTVQFLWREGATASHIHMRLAAVCGEAAPSHAGKTFTSNDKLQVVFPQWRQDTQKEGFAMQMWKLPE
ncbi:hypothetical protein B7P43_G02059 [Cryptotermes secundus]|uniref:Uncharacterized protein n=1 Tax=Cryptotermes secundus TaxID=105785 RepID=A0A2J7QQU1_9NEOP|nr:hypothetical protein B7P43_G02059 [Cryptotermes secundus]